MFPYSRALSKECFRSDKGAQRSVIGQICSLSRLAPVVCVHPPSLGGVPSISGDQPFSRGRPGEISPERSPLRQRCRLGAVFGDGETGTFSPPAPSVLQVKAMLNAVANAADPRRGGQGVVG